MSFKEWLYSELKLSGIIDDTYDEDDINLNTLYAETELTEDDYEQYKNEFEDYCESAAQEPIWDLE